MEMTRKPTKLVPEEKFNGSCQNCGAGWSAQRRELRVQWDMREKGEFGQAQCGNCGHLINFYPARTNSIGLSA
jgi:hypothetical protein